MTKATLLFLLISITGAIVITLLNKDNPSMEGKPDTELLNAAYKLGWTEGAKSMVELINNGDTNCTAEFKKDSIRQDAYVRRTFNK